MEPSMIKLIVSLLLPIGMCCAADGQLPSQELENEQVLMQMFLSKSQKERQDIIYFLHRMLHVHIFAVRDEDQQIVYNGTDPDDLTLLGDVMHAMLAKQMHLDASRGEHILRLDEHNKLLSQCNANIAKLVMQMVSFEDKTTQAIAHMDGRLSNLEIGMVGLEGKVDCLKQLLSDQQPTS